jgi:hypothetical protein
MRSKDIEIGKVYESHELGYATTYYRVLAISNEAERRAEIRSEHISKGRDGALSEWDKKLARRTVQVQEIAVRYHAKLTVHSEPRAPRWVYPRDIHAEFTDSLEDAQAKLDAARAREKAEQARREQEIEDLRERAIFINDLLQARGVKGRAFVGTTQTGGTLHAHVDPEDLVKLLSA